MHQSLKSQKLCISCTATHATLFFSFFLWKSAAYCDGRRAILNTIYGFYFIPRTGSNSSSSLLKMRNFGATAPPLLPEPTVCDANSEEPSSTTAGDQGAARTSAAESSDWPNGESSCTNKPSDNTNLDNIDIKGAQSLAGFGDNMQSVDATSGTKRLAKELDEFVSKGSKSDLPAEEGDSGPLSDDAIADLQLQTARKLRQVSLVPFLSHSVTHSARTTTKQKRWREDALLGFLSNSSCTKL